MTRTTIAIALAIGLTGCAGFEQQPEAETTTPTVTKPVESKDVSETVRIIDRLDKAGCDFAGITIVRGEMRKHHGEISVTCREAPLY